MLMKKVKILLACLILATSSWAATTVALNPTNEAILRYSGTPATNFVNVGSTTKLTTADDVEIKSNAQFFMLQQYDFTGVNQTADEISDLTFKIGKGQSAAIVAIWLYEADPQGSYVGSESNWISGSFNFQSIHSNTLYTTGAEFASSTEVKMPLDTATFEKINNQECYFFKLTGEALTKVLNYSASHNNRVTLLITTVSKDGVGKMDLNCGTQVKVKTRLTTDARKPTATFTYNYSLVRNETQGTDYDNLQAALDANNDGDVIILNGDIQLTTRLNAKNTVTIKDNGKKVTIYRTKNKNNMMVLPNTSGKTITFEGTALGNLVFDGSTCTDETQTAFEASHGATLSLKNVVIQNITTTNKAAAINIHNSGGQGKIVLENVSFKNIVSTSEENPAVIYGSAMTDDMVTFKGNIDFASDITINHCYFSQWREKAVAAENVTVTNPILLNYAGWPEQSGKILVKGTINSDAFTIPETQCASGWFVIANEADNNVLIRNTPADAIITNTTQTKHYSTLWSAIHYAAEGDVLTINKNFTVNQTVAVDKSLTFYGYNKTITNATGSFLMYNSTTNANITLKGENGSNRLIIDGNNTATNEYALVANNGATLTLQNVKMQNINTSAKQGVIFCKGTGSLVMDNVRFDNCSNTGDFKTLVFVGNNNCILTNKIEIPTAGSADQLFYIENDYHITATNPTNDKVIGIKVDATKRTEHSVVVQGCNTLNKFNFNGEGLNFYVNGSDICCQHLIKNLTKDTYELDLATAVANAEEGDEIQVMNDITLTARLGVDKAITIKGRTPQTKILRGTGLDNLLILAQNKEVTLKDITLDGQSVSRERDGIECGNNSKLTLDNVTMQNFVPTNGKADVCVNGNGVILTNTNILPNGIRLNKNKRVENNNATHTEPIQLILAGDYDKTNSIVLTCNDASLYTAKDASGYYWKLNVTQSGTKYELKGEKAPWQYDLTVSDAGMATLVLGFDATLPEGVKAYQLTNDGTNVIEATSVNAITKNEPVLVVAPAGVYTFAASEIEVLDEQADPQSGCLIGSYKSINVPECTDGVYNYILAVGGEGVGFYQVADGSCTIGKNRAYLSCTYDSQAGNGNGNKGPMRISFIEQSTTNLERTQVEGIFKKVMMDNQILILREGHLYRIDGQKVK